MIACSSHSSSNIASLKDDDTTDDYDDNINTNGTNNNNTVDINTVDNDVSEEELHETPTQKGPTKCKEKQSITKSAKRNKTIEVTPKSDDNMASLLIEKKNGDSKAC
jgi:hypothetical protein